jgi:hypothetical protein
LTFKISQKTVDGSRLTVDGLARNCFRQPSTVYHFLTLILLYHKNCFNMRKLKIGLIALFALTFVFSAEAYKAPEREGKPAQANKPVNFRVDCTTAQGNIDQDVNNVRARLNNGGDVWWDRANGSYIVPKVANDETPVSSIYAGAVWLGGIDPGGNLKVAAQTYGNQGSDSDFWAGPIDPETGATDKEICDNWDKFFVVTKQEVQEHLFRLQDRIDNGTAYTEDQIPAGVKGWPGRANEYFEEINGFPLPSTSQGLAGFWDETLDGIYEPLDGDFPIIEIVGCKDLENLPPPPDQMIFWIYNDSGDFGNVHGESGGDKIQMEVQVQAFAYSSDDEINNMTFQRYKLINRADENIDSTYFAMWVDADLGCANDDFVGCDTARSLAYIYNADAADGISGISCDGVPTYGTNIPIVGIDYFRGPLDEDRNELGMSSFTYYSRGGQGQPPGTEDPNSAIEYYRYLSGSWRDGSPFEFGGDGYQEGTFPIKYAFPSQPNGTQDSDWSSCHPNPGAQPLDPLDRRTIQASGPFTLQPGAVNELIIGVVWVADQVYPCPKLNTLLFADETAQALFNNCFDLNEGPDAPDADWVELDREIIAVLSNDSISFNTNNSSEGYFEPDAFAPADLSDSVKAYVFEGYLLYQLKGPQVGADELTNPDKARLIRQVDINNGITKIYNWKPVNEEDNPDFISEPILVPDLIVDGEDKGIRHTFQITTDAFADGDTRLINHKKYFYTVRSYGHNEYEQYDPVEGTGQKLPAIVGGGNVGDESGLGYYTVIPRPITDKTLNAEYGAGAPITRVDGVGVGGNFVDITAESRNRMFAAGEVDQFDDQDDLSTFDGIIDYKDGAGPIEVQVYNPLEVKDGDYQITFVDENMDNDILDNNVRWVLTDLNDPSLVIESSGNISNFNDQVLAELGITVGIGQTPDVGTKADRTNGVIGADIEYLDENKVRWFNALPDEWAPGITEYNVSPFYPAVSPQIYDYADTDLGGANDGLDPFQALTNIGEGFFFPFLLGDFRNRATNPVGGYISPNWKPNGGLVSNTAPDFLPLLRNIDIVFTSDKSKWSRCVIIEMRTPEYNTFPTPTGETAKAEGNRLHMQARAAKSVGKEAGADGMPMPDGDTWEKVNSSGTVTDSGDREGMGWFPGYAVDVETGERLNVFFGENSAYDESNGSLDRYTGVQLDDNGSPVIRPTGRDMMFNPTSQPYLDFLGADENATPTIFDFVSGGQHWIYVDGQKYDRCENLHSRLDPERQSNQFSPVSGLKRVQWSGLPLLPRGVSMLSYANGLIPNDMIMKVRVDNPYQVKVGTGEFNGYPTYRFSLEGVEADELTDATIESALDQIAVVPNPYYAYSEYETQRNNSLVKITNLPAKCIVTIYSLDGKFIRRYNRDENPTDPRGSGIPSNQILPDVEWDLKNNKGISISSGVYLIHVDATAIGWGERTIKWFGINNKFDSSGL